MYIDVHGHFTSVPRELKAWRDRQIAQFESDGTYLSSEECTIPDEQIVAAMREDHVPMQAEFGIDVGLFSPIAGWMAHHYGDQRVSREWSRLTNDVVHRAVQVFPRQFVGVCQLPQSPGASIDASIEELERCVGELGFVGCNLSPDPSDGYWTGPPVTDKSFYPLYEKLVELDVPAMLHVSMSCNPAVQNTGAHYLNGDTTAFMQLATSDLFVDFPDLKLIIPHGGGAVPYHWSRYRGLLNDMGRSAFLDLVGTNVFFDTCVYDQHGIELLTANVPTRGLLFASEMLGAVRGTDPETGKRYDDTRSLLANVASLDEESLRAISHENALRVFGRLRAVLEERGHEL